MTKRIALVTGGMGGLGEAICVKLAKMGIQVVVTYSPGNTKHAEWLKEMKGQGLDFSAYACDVSDFDSCAQAVAKVVKELGPIDILINNAGITRDMTFKKMTKVDWDAVIATNLTAAFALTQAAIKHMIRQRSGRIISISSVVGQAGNAGQANYAASKAGLIGFSKAVALEVASRGITVNVVAPGLIETDMTKAMTGQAREGWENRIPLKRLGTPEDVAAAVCFLASQEASYITGQVLAVNGGMYM